MPPKRTKSAASVAGKENKWEQTLMNAVFCEKDLWEATVVFIVANKLNDVPYLKVISESVASGTRRLYSIINKDDVFTQIEGASKGGKGKKDATPAGGTGEIYEKCKPYMDNDTEIPMPLLANLIKHELLEIKAKDMTRRDIFRKPSSALEKAGKKGAKGADRAKSAVKGKPGKKTPEVVGKAGSKMKKRGDDEVQVKYIDDEPDIGPEHYILVVGFTYPHLFSHLVDIGINVDCILKVESEDYPASESTMPADDDNVEKDEKQLVVEESEKYEKAQCRHELKKYWKDILPLLQIDSKLHDVARLTYRIKSNIIPEHLEDNEKRLRFGTAMYEEVACLIYDLLDSKRQWQNFLKHLNLIHIPAHKRELFSSNVDVQSLHSGGGTRTGAGAAATAPQGGATTTDTKVTETTSQMEADVAGDPDTRYYNDLMNTIPVESVSVPIIMHCMLEQVVASEDDKDIGSETPKPPRPDGLEDSVSQHVSSAVYKLGLSESERQLLMEDFDQPKTPGVPSTGPILINHHDDVTRRLNHLKPIDDFDARRVEMEMASFHPAANVHCASTPDMKTTKERAARLQELLNFISFGHLNQAEVDQAFRQFVFECMDITQVDPLREINPPPRVAQRDIPWDDPYPFYVQMIPPAEEVEESPTFSRLSGGSRSALDTIPMSASWEEGLDNLSLDGSATRLAGGSARQSRSSLKKKSLCGSAKEPTPPQMRTNMEICTDELIAPISQVPSTVTTRSASPSSILKTDKADISLASVHFKEHAQRGVKVTTSGRLDYGTINMPLKWSNLDQWCFVEHMEPHILQQVLNDVMYSHPVMDSYYNKRDHALMLVLHNPHNQQLQNQTMWQTFLHSDVGFRNYLEHVAHLIESWTREQEAKYQAYLLQWAAEKKAKEIASMKSTDNEGSRPGSGQSKRKGRSSSPTKKSPSRRSSSERSASNANALIRNGSIKANNLEEERQRAEDEERETVKQETRKSAGKKNSKEEKEPKDRKRANSHTSNRSKSIVKDEAQVSVPITREPPSKHHYPFTGYTLGDALLHLSGEITTLFPADGGQICVEKTEFTQGTVSVKACLKKDGHIFTVHVLNPRVPGEDEEEDTVTLPNPSKHVVGQEKSETEKSEKEELSSRVPTVPVTLEPDSAVDGAIPIASSAPHLQAAPKKPCVGSFGSFSALLSDGMSLSLSIYGDLGEPADGKPYQPEVYSPQQETASIISKEVPVAAPHPKPKGKGEKSEKGDKSEKSDKGKEKSQPSPEPPASQEDDLLKLDETMERRPTVEQPLHQLHLACPDGLVVTFHPETHYGIIPDDPDKPMLVVRQCYPVKTRGLQSCEVTRSIVMDEASRVITSMGTVVKTMTDGRTTVLFASGTVSQLLPNSTLVPCTTQTEQESPRRPTTPTKGDRETPTKKRTKLESVVPREKGISGKRRSAEKRRQNEPPEAAPADDEPPEPKWHWITTTPSGERIVTRQNEDTNIPVTPALVSKASDPSTMQTMFSREDGVVMVTHPSGATVVEHADGTRISTYFKEMPSTLENQEPEIVIEEPILVTEVPELITDDPPPPTTQASLVMFIQVECPGYAAVIFNTKHGDCQVQFGNGTTVNTALNGCSDIYHQNGGYMRIDENGAAIYYPKPNPHIEVTDPDHQQVYLMKHYDEMIMETVDNEGNTFNVRHTGETSIAVTNCDTLSSHETDAHVVSDSSSVDSTTLAKRMITYKQHAPRFFVIQPDGSGTEFLRYQDVAEYIAEAEDDPLTAILMDPLPDFPSVTGITVLKPYSRDVSQKWILPYTMKSIIPAGLVSRDLETLPSREVKTEGPPFGTCVGRGLVVGNVVHKELVPPVVQCPSMLEVRQLLQYKPVSQELRYHLTSCLRRYSEAVLSRMVRTEGLMPVDPRTEGEKILAEDLHNRLPPLVPNLSSESLDELIMDKTKPVPLPFSDMTIQTKNDLKALYEKVTVVHKTSPPPTPQPTRCKADWERFQREFEEVMEAKKLLKEKKIPSYFESALGKAFLLSQAPDLAQLTRELAHARNVSENDPRNGIDSNSTNSSTSVPQEPSDNLSYTPMTGGPQGSTDLNPSPNIGASTRPCNPTPGHATGQGSPAPLRPKNPTPVHAAKNIPDRPGAPTPKEAIGSSRHPSIPEQPEQMVRDTRQGRNSVQSALKDVVGDPRQEPISLPSYFGAGRPGAIPNQKFGEVEAPVRRQVLTASVAGATDKALIGQMRGFELLPKRVDFGVLREGNTYSFQVQLKNVGFDACRFRVQQPPPSTGLKAIFQPGLVAAGMKVDLNMELYAIAVGVPSQNGVGRITHTLEITTEADHLYLPITAMSSYDYDHRDPQWMPLGFKGPGVKLVSTKPPAGVGIIRPRKDTAIGVQ